MLFLRRIDAPEPPIEHEAGTLRERLFSGLGALLGGTLGAAIGVRETLFAVTIAAVSGGPVARRLARAQAAGASRTPE